MTPPRCTSARFPSRSTTPPRPSRSSTCWARRMSRRRHRVRARRADPRCGRAAAAARARVRCGRPGRGRARAGRARTGPARGRLRLRGLLAGRHPRSRRDADLHLGHHRAAEGRRADPPSLLAESRPVDRVTPLQPGGRLVSYLPMAHLADRWSSTTAACGRRPRRHLRRRPQPGAAGLLEVRPTSSGAVPRVWEKLKAALEAGFAAEPDPDRRAAVAQALDVGIAGGALPRRPASRARARSRRPTRGPTARCSRALRAQLGLDQVNYLVSGAAPIAPRGARVLHAPSGCRSARCGACASCP